MASKYLPHWEKLWSREYLLDRVSAFHEKGLPVYVKWIYDHEKAMDSAARRRFESWNEVLRLVGLDPKRISPRGLKQRSYLDKAAVIRGIQARQKRGLPLNHHAVARGKKRDIGLLRGAQREFGTWNKVLRAAGVNLKVLHENVWRPKRKYPDVAAVLRAIRLAAQHSFALHFAGQYGLWRASLPATS